MTGRPDSKELADLEVFLDCREQAEEWIKEHGTQALVDELRAAVAERRRVKLGTPNTLILLRHIENQDARLQAAEQALGRIEWLDRGEEYDECPVCGQSEASEHLPNCGLLAARRALEGAAE